MGQKYSINSAGRIVAERDIYSLGGFIPKGSLGGFIADETQLSQDGECWLSGGDISTRPDVRIKDNAYIGDFFVNEQAIHTDVRQRRVIPEPKPRRGRLFCRVMR